MNVPSDLQLQWLGHTSLEIGHRYNHANDEDDYRQSFAERPGIESLLDPNRPKSHTSAGIAERS